MSARDLTDQELADELKRRGYAPKCSCGWQTYLGPYDQDGFTWRCHGCLRAIERCQCR